MGELKVNSSRWLAALAAGSTLIAGCATSSTTQQDVSVSVDEERSLDPIRSGLLDETVPDAMKSAGIPGAMVGIWSRNGDYVKAFGVADTATGSPMQVDFFSRIGSVTKTFTAFTVAGWIGHNGSVPGYQTVAIYLPERETTLVVMINTDIAVPGGGDPSAALVTAITAVITPDNVYRL